MSLQQNGFSFCSKWYSVFLHGTPNTVGLGWKTNTCFSKCPSSWGCWESGHKCLWSPVNSIRKVLTLATMLSPSNASEQASTCPSCHLTWGSCLFQDQHGPQGRWSVWLTGTCWDMLYDIECVTLFCASLSSHPLASASHVVCTTWATGCCPQYCGTNRRLSSGCSSPSSQGQWSEWLERQNAEIHCMKSNIVPRSRWQRESEYQTQLLIHHLGKGKTSDWRNDVPNRCAICLLET